MANLIKLIKNKSKGHIIKALSKTSLRSCPTGQTNLLSGPSKTTLSRLILYVITLCTFCVTLWKMSASGEDIIAIQFSSDKEMVRAFYKCAYENQDDSVDLVFSIPKGGKKLLQQQRHLRLNASRSGRRLPGKEPHGKHNTTRSRARSRYPASLDSDYAINIPNICPTGQPVDYLIIVHSATVYFERRRAIRETFGGKRIFGNIVQRVVFILGITSDPVTTRSIQEEAFINRDVVQGQFVDSYHNLTHKGVLGYRWVLEYCPQAKIIIKIDDDVFVNPFKLVQDILPAFTNKTRHIACQVRPSGTSLITRGQGKWQVDEDVFKGYRHYPFDYCSGYFVIITSDLIRPMMNAARLNPFFWIDEIYLFGILPATIGDTTFVDIKDNLTMTFNSGQKCYQEKGSRCQYIAVSEWRPEEPDNLWYQLLSSLTTAVKRELNVFGFS